MSKRIDRAIAAYQRATTPEAIKAMAKEAKRTGCKLVTAAEIRIGHAMDLEYVLNEEITRAGHC
jgi:hypothetical protein